MLYAEHLCRPQDNTSREGCAHVASSLQPRRNKPVCACSCSLATCTSFDRTGACTHELLPMVLQAQVTSKAGQSILINLEVDRSVHTRAPNNGAIVPSVKIRQAAHRRRRRWAATELSRSSPASARFLTSASRSRMSAWYFRWFATPCCTSCTHTGNKS